MNIRYLPVLALATSILFASMGCAPVDLEPVAESEENLSSGVVTSADLAAKAEFSELLAEVSPRIGTKPEAVAVVSYKQGFFGTNPFAARAIVEALPSLKPHVKRWGAPPFVLGDSLQAAIANETIDLPELERNLRGIRTAESEIQAAVARAKRSNDAHATIGKALAKLTGPQAFTIDDGGMPALRLMNVMVGRLPSGNLLVVYRDLL